MKLFEVKNHSIYIEGNQSQGWIASDSENAKDISLNFEIEELKNEGGFLLLVYSDNEEIYADTWHQTIEDALEVAVDEYGIEKTLWKEIK